MNLKFFAENVKKSLFLSLYRVDGQKDTGAST
jgi:hypothetical protein